MAGLAILPSKVVSGLGHTAPSDKLNIAVVGVGGVGFRNLNHLKEENIVALCDVDTEYAEKSIRRWSNAHFYTDYRVMLEQEKSIDAVVVATPDHTHSIIAMAAMQQQKHVYVQPPMAHSVFEVRRMTETSRVFNVVSQVGNQVASGDGTRLISELIWEGTIGAVHKAYAWTSYPLWKQGCKIGKYKGNIPKNLNWDMFVGPTKMVDYNPLYTPYAWRGWWNFGNGALGGMAPHLLEPLFRALKLNQPATVQACSSEFSLEFAPKSSQIIFGFDRRDNIPKVSMPKFKLYWYDGGLRPECPEGLPSSVRLNSIENGVIIVGDEGIILYENQGDNVQVFKGGIVTDIIPKQQLHRIDAPFTGGHETDFVRACKESGNNRLLPSADFDSQLALNETILVGNMAIRLQSLQQPLKWDSTQMKFSNIYDSDTFRISQIENLSNEKGVIKPVVSNNEYNAADFVRRTIHPIHRTGWEQI